MTDFILNLALHAEGLNEQQVAQVEKAMPVFQRLLNMAVADKDLLLSAATIATKLQPLVTEAAKDWDTIGPAVKLVDDAVNKW